LARLPRLGASRRVSFSSTLTNTGADLRLLGNLGACWRLVASLFPVPSIGADPLAGTDVSRLAKRPRSDRAAAGL
jgi:hypothetical protein